MLLALTVLLDVQDEIKRIEEQIEHERSVAKGDENSFIGYLTGALHEIFLKGIRNRLGLIFMLFMFRRSPLRYKWESCSDLRLLLENFSGVNSINYVRVSFTLVNSRLTQDVISTLLRFSRFEDREQPIIELTLCSLSGCLTSACTPVFMD